MNVTVHVSVNVTVLTRRCTAENASFPLKKTWVLQSRRHRPTDPPTRDKGRTHQRGAHHADRPTPQEPLTRSHPLPDWTSPRWDRFAPDIICAPRSTRSLLSTASGSGRPARRESRWPVDVARLASRRRAHAPIRARQRAQHHAFIFVHADLQPTCSMIMFMAEQRLLACSKRNRRANTIRAVPPFSRLQNACRCPTCSTPCSCNRSPGSSAMCTGFWSRTT